MAEHRTAHYARLLAEWQFEHGADRNDLTPAQRERFALWVEINFDESLARWLVKERERRSGVIR